MELEANQVDCHHKKPLVLSGNDSYQNLIIVSDVVHILIHSSNERTIRKYLKVLNRTKNSRALRQELIKQKFAEWIWKDIDRRELLCRFIKI